MLPIFINLLLVIHVLVSLLIILMVLMQRPKSEGLGAAFGGGMTDNLFGAQTTNVLQGFTRWLGGIFFALTLLLSVLYARQSVSESEVQKRLKKTAAPAAAAAALPVAANPGAAVPVAAATPPIETGTPSPAPSASPAPTASPSPIASPSPTATPTAKPKPSAAKKTRDQ